MTGVDDRTRIRLVVVALVVVAGFGVLLARLWFLQVLSTESFSEQAQNNHVRIIWQQAPRGRILDAKGRVLVSNRTALAAGVIRDDLPKSKRARAAVIKRLADLTGVTPRHIEQRLADKRRSPFQPVVVVDDITPEMYFTINERQDQFPGVDTLELAVRQYPHGTIAAHVLGYVNEVTEGELKSLKGYRLGDQIGRIGIERQYERYLRGTPELRKLEVDAAGRVLGSLGGLQPDPGKDVQLTLDLDVQRVAERALLDGIRRARQQTFEGERFRAPGGAAVVLDTRTGGVVALANYPTFDLSEFVGGVSEDYYASLTSSKANFPLLNRATLSAYPPGSTFKPMMAVAALQSGIASAGGRYPCTTEFRFGDTVFRNWTSRNASISLAQSLVESCDTVFYQYARTWWGREQSQVANGRTPTETMQLFARRFGLGQPTGIDLPEGSEDAGRIPDRAWRRSVWEQNKDDYCARADRTRDLLYRDLCDRGFLWRGGDSVNMSIGQGDVLTTPLQVANAYAAIANGGTLMRPHLGARVLGPAGKVVAQLAPKPHGKVNVSASALGYVRRALPLVAEEGTARYPFRAWPLDQIPVAAKTGSSEIAGKQPFSWFAAYAPANAPRYVVIAVVEQAGRGSQVAGPVVRRIMDELFDRPALPIVYGTVSD